MKLQIYLKSTSMTAFPLFCGMNLKRQFNGGKLLDIGTGGGFPSVILAIAFEGLNVIANDSRRHPMTISFLPFVLLCIALSTDTFTAGLSYSAGRVRVPVTSILILSLVSGLTFTLSLLAGEKNNRPSSRRLYQDFFFSYLAFFVLIQIV